MVFASEGTCVCTANYAQYVVNAMGALSVSTANYAQYVVNAMGALSVNTANDAHDVVNVVALNTANTCGLPARAKNAQCVIYVVPRVTLSTVDVFAET